MSDAKKFAKTYKLRKKDDAEGKVKEFVKNYKKSEGSMPCGTGLAGKICSHNKKKLNKADQATYDFPNVQATVNAAQHASAEITAAPELIQYLSAAADAELSKIPFAKGILTVSKKDEGLYSGFFQDTNGQVIEKFENMTIPILAKNLQIKNLYTAPSPVEVAQPSPVKHDDEVEDRELIREALDTHNALYHQGQAPGEPINGNKGYVRIKYGNFELEIKKSMHDFIKSYKADAPTKSDVKKALAAWRRNSNAASQFRSDLDAANALVTDWAQYGEEFSQILFAMQMKHEK